MKLLYSFFTILSIFFITACTNNTVDPEEATVTVNFAHLINNVEVVLDDIRYSNKIGQDYSIKTVKYFVSRITFHKSDGTELLNPDIHYVDIRDLETLALELNSKIPYGAYDRISFVYGLVSEDNITGSLGLDLDRLMEWPDRMGGGYHYMKLEGEYVGSNETTFFNFHAGGLAGDSYEIHVDLPNSNFVINQNTMNFDIVMEISNWFTNPVDWDFEYWGSGIMGNPDAQTTVQKNGIDVFSINFMEETI